MTKRRWIIAVFFFAALVALLVTLADTSPANPIYKGRKLSAWIEDIVPLPTRPNAPPEALYIGWQDRVALRNRFPAPAEEAAIAAIRNIGTNAIPYLLDLTYDIDSPFKTKLILWSRQQKWLSVRAKTAPERRGHALAALVELGPASLWAWADTLTNRLARPEVRFFALSQLRALGRRAAPAAPAMFQARHDLDAMFRSSIRHALRECDPAGAFTAYVDLEEGDDMSRSRAAQALGRIEQPPQVAIAGLSKALTDESHWVRHSAVVALGRYGINAISASDAIHPLLSDAELRVRKAATNALKQILTGKSAPDS